MSLFNGRESGKNVPRTLSLEERPTFNGEDPHLTENPLFEGNRRQPGSVRRQVSEPSSNAFAVRPKVSQRRSVRSAVDGVKNKTADFFCVNDDENDFEKWTLRRKRLLNRKCGKLKESDTFRVVRDSEGADVTDGVAVDGLPGEYEEPITKAPVLKLTWNGLTYVTTTLKNRLSSSRSKKNDVRLNEVRSDTVTGDVDSVFIEPQSANYSVPSSPQTTTQVNEQLKTFLPGGDEQMSVKGKNVKAKLRTTTLNKAVESQTDSRERRIFGMTFFRKKRTPEVKKVIEDLDDHRPFFTYWITTVQLLVLFISIWVYGFGPIGFTKVQKRNLVMVVSLSLQQVDYFEPANLYIGPRAADLIHLGAKFAPCMRADTLVFNEISKERRLENDTACCIRNDESGCVQTVKEKCSGLLSQWVKWTPENPGPPIRYPNGYISSNRISGSVCGQDPKYCEEPASASPHEWPDDITKWPICRKPVTGKIQAEPHMACELIGRPCCIGTLGQCIITTREHCDFVRGFFHEEATLCSQVSCMEDVCGMFPFYSSDTPNQFYRLWISLFLHAGILHLLITVLLQFYIMRDIEKMAGTLRTAFIYLISGIGGNLASSIFVPYRAEVGPSGSQSGLLACLIVEVLNSWDIIEHPKKNLTKLCTIAAILFLFGLLPWIDNYAHIFGFIIGFLLSLALLPYVTIKPYKKKLKVTLIIASLVCLLVLFALLLLLFYVFPVYNCPWCKYLNCIPFTNDWCDRQDIEVKRVDIL